MGFRERKEQRKKYYEENIKGWKLVEYTSCSGSGYYDDTGSPKCGACNGTGRERNKPYKK